MKQINKPKEFNLHEPKWELVSNTPIKIMLASKYGSFGVDPINDNSFGVIQAFENTEQQQAYEEAIQMIMESFRNQSTFLF